MIAFALITAMLTSAPSGEGWRVIDGDTLALGEERLRLESIDTPERQWRAGCDAEFRLAELASRRVEHLIREAQTIEIERSGQDYYRRTLATVHVDDRTISAVLIEEGLAVAWSGRRHDWCAPRG